MAFKDDGVNTIDDVVMRIRKLQDTFTIVNAFKDDTLDPHTYRAAAAVFMQRYGFPIKYTDDAEHILEYNMHTADVRNGAFPQPLVDMAESVYRMGSKIMKVYSGADDPTRVFQGMLMVLENLPDPRDVRSECSRWSRLVTQDNRRKISRVPGILTGPAAELADYFRHRISHTREGQQPALIAEYQHHLGEIHTLLAAGGTPEDHVQRVGRYVQHVTR